MRPAAAAAPAEAAAPAPTAPADLRRRWHHQGRSADPGPRRQRSHPAARSRAQPRSCPTRTPGAHGPDGRGRHPDPGQAGHRRVPSAAEEKAATNGHRQPSTATAANGTVRQGRQRSTPRSTAAPPSRRQAASPKATKAARTPTPPRPRRTPRPPRRRRAPRPTPKADAKAGGRRGRRRAGRQGSSQGRREADAADGRGTPPSRSVRRPACRSASRAPPGSPSTASSRTPRPRAQDATPDKSGAKSDAPAAKGGRLSWLPGRAKAAAEAARPRPRPRPTSPARCRPTCRPGWTTAPRSSRPASPARSASAAPATEGRVCGAGRRGASPRPRSPRPPRSTCPRSG